MKFEKYRNKRKRAVDYRLKEDVAMDVVANVLEQCPFEGDNIVCRNGHWKLSEPRVKHRRERENDAESRKAWKGNIRVCVCVCVRERERERMRREGVTVTVTVTVTARNGEPEWTRLSVYRVRVLVVMVIISNWWKPAKFTFIPHLKKKRVYHTSQR